MRKKMYILGISAFYHDAAAALVLDGEIIAAAQEERFTRRKHDASFPENAIRYCLEEAGITLAEVQTIAFYDKPFLKFERILETYYAYAPKGFTQFVTAMPIWMKEKIFLKKRLKDALTGIGNFDEKKTILLFPEHHLSHAASAFFPSPFKEAIILTLDGVGEWDTASISYGKDGGIKVLQTLHYPHSLGLLYSSFTYFLGFRVNAGEYKLMGLAPYGNPEAEETQRYKQLILSELISLNEDGSFTINARYFSYSIGTRMVNEQLWKKLFGMGVREPESTLEQRHCDLALAIQQVTEKIVMRMAKEAIRLTGSRFLCLAGGVALNCVANGKLSASGLFEDIFVQPASGDAGGALGAALAATHIYFQHPRTPLNPDGMKGAYLGPSFPDKIIRTLSIQYQAVFTEAESTESLLAIVAGLLAEGKIVGWFQGRMEFGPRALGNRSILADTRNPEMQKKLNLSVKYREGFRPFAPVVTAASAHRYFEMKENSPYMLFTFPLKESLRNPLPPNYAQLPLLEKLYFSRSAFPAITHVDFSARVQTVHTETNPLLHGLIEAFERLTGESMLVNTSFNVRGEPPVCTPEDAYHCFMNTEIEVLVLHHFIFLKSQQPEWKKQKNVLLQGID